MASGLHVFHLLLVCAAQTFAVQILSEPAVNAEGLIVTRLEQSVSLVCQAGAEEELQWLRNGAPVQLSRGNNTGRSSVCVTPVTHEDDGATFTCRAKSDSAASASVTLDVQFPPLLSGSEDVSVEEDDVLVLRCDVWANPPVTSVSWTQNGTALDLAATGFTASNDGYAAQLRCGSVERRVHQGAYQCLVAYPAGGTFNKSFTVTVTDKTLKFPLMPIIAGVVVVACTSVLAVLARWSRITKCCKRGSSRTSD